MVQTARFPFLVMEAIGDAFARCWDQFLDACSYPVLIESDAWVADRPLPDPLPARFREPVYPDEIDRLVSYQLRTGSKTGHR